MSRCFRAEIAVTVGLFSDGPQKEYENQPKVPRNR